MEMQLDWRSQQGTKTGDNRDYGGVGIRPDGVLCLALDGSTSGPKSGELAGQIARDVIDWYVATDENVTAETLTAQLRKTHGSLSKRFPLDTASYVIVRLARTGPALVLHAGDCLLGQWKGKSPLQWLIGPHTLANVIDEILISEIAKNHVRHRLTRSFRAREFIPPDVTEIKVEQGSSLIAATDGFWAELNSEEQAMLMRGQIFPVIGEADDRSVLTLRLLDNEQGIKFSLNDDRSENFYISGPSRSEHRGK
jgi:PPM family protein phosphatase